MSRWDGLTPEERFWSYVDTSGECWTWTGATGGSGNSYGQIQVNGRRIRAHRFSYELAYGPIPEGLVIDHKCHVRKCVRPEHLQAVTIKQNLENHGGALPSSKTGIRGVSWSRKERKYVVFVRHYGRNYNCGSFDDIADAEAAAIAKRNELHTNNLQDRMVTN